VSDNFIEADGQKKFPWQTLSALAMRKGIQPHRFWKMCPGEVFAFLLAEENKPSVPMTRQELDILMSVFPDRSS